DNFSEFKQTNQYAEALYSIPGIVDQYLATKLKEAVDVAVQLKYDRIREEAHTDNQQFLDSIDEGMKKVIKEQVKKEVSKITPQIEKLVNEQLESEVLVRSSKEAKTSHAVAANLSELELKKILIDKMEANNSINRSDIQRQLYKALVDAYEADKILLDTYGDTVTIKRPRDGADDDQEPSAGTDRGSKRRRSGKEPESTSAPRETTTTTAGKTTTGSKTHKQSASQSAPVEETMQSTDVFEAPAHQEFETGVHDEQAEEENVQKKVVPKACGRPSIGLLKAIKELNSQSLPRNRIGVSALKTFWRPNDKVNERANDLVIDKRLKTRRIMRSLERFVGGKTIWRYSQLKDGNLALSNINKALVGDCLISYESSLWTYGNATNGAILYDLTCSRLWDQRNYGLFVFTLSCLSALRRSDNEFMLEYDESNTYVLEKIQYYSLAFYDGGGGFLIPANYTRSIATAHTR
ncbi:hypothetical protein Tco_1054741, partial [Tanacetum coccineum]